MHPGFPNTSHILTLKRLKISRDWSRKQRDQTLAEYVNFFLLIYQLLISYIELLKTEGHRPSNCHLLLIVLETGSARPRSRQVLYVWKTPFFFPLGCCFFSVPRQGRKMPENVNSSNATSTHGFIYPLLFPKAVPPNSITLACGPTLKSGDHLVPTSQCVV